MFLISKDKTELTNMDNVLWAEQKGNKTELHFMNGETKSYEIDIEALAGFLHADERRPTKIDAGTLNVKVVNK